MNCQSRKSSGFFICPPVWKSDKGINSYIVILLQIWYTASNPIVLVTQGKVIHLEKRYLGSIVTILLSCVLTFAMAGSGDINGDGAFDNLDAAALRDYLTGNLESVNTVVADLDTDGTVSMSDLMVLERLLVSGERPGDGIVSRRDVVFGQSQLNRDLVVTIIEPERYDRTVLLVFAVHGMIEEPHDGQILVDAANRVIEHFESQDTMFGCRLLVVACANPDGVMDGTSATSFGRCNKRRVDINSNFPVAHIHNRLGPYFSQNPFSEKETCALRDLVLEYKPDVVIDFDGWDRYTMGDSEIAQVFSEEFYKSHSANFDSKQHGAFTLWAHSQGAKALRAFLTKEECEGDTLLHAMDRIVAHNYSEEIAEPDPRFEKLPEFSGYALEREKILTYVDIGGAQIGYISGRNDRCVIERIYNNGWVRVRYPIKEGEKIAYCLLSAFFDKEALMNPVNFEEAKIYTPVYSRYNMYTRLEGIRRIEDALVISQTDDAYQVIYPNDKTDEWRMGWVSKKRVTVASSDDSDETGAQQEEVKKTYTGKLLAAGVQIDGGQAFDLPIYVQADTMTALRLWIEYDTGALELVGVDDGGTMKGFSMGNLSDVSPYRILWADSEAGETRQDGKLVTLHFRARPTSQEQETPLLVYAKTGDALTENLERVKISLEPYVAPEPEPEEVSATGTQQTDEAPVTEETAVPGEGEPVRINDEMIPDLASAENDSADDAENKGTAFTTATDLATVTDLATGTDLATVTDLATGTDLATVTDLATGTDLATMTDLATGTDLATMTDLATVTDLATGTDLATVTDLATGTDVSTTDLPAQTDAADTTDF